MSLHLVHGVAVEDSGEGPAVICVHGLGGTSNTWSAMQPAFAGYRLIRMDLPGCGRSVVDTAQIQVEDMVACLQTICQTLSVDTAQWLGHSMGTIVCQHLALSAPRLVKSLLLFGPLVAPADPAREALRQRADKVRQGGLAGLQEVTDSLLNTAVSAHTKDHNPSAGAFVRESLMRQSPQSYADYCLALSQVRAADIERIQAPTLLITGDADAVAPPAAVQAMARRMPKASSQVLHRCGHWTPVEKPHECMRETRQFLKRYA
jgi:3-oxoadipate enol-lactonase